MSETFYMTIDCGNDAFRNDPGAEISRILRDCANKTDRLEPDDDPIQLRDINGNRVGAMWVTTD